MRAGNSNCIPRQTSFLDDPLKVVRNELTSHTAAELARLIRERVVSPVAVAEAYLNRIEEINPKLNAIVTLAPDVMERAKQAEATIMQSGRVGALHGVPVTVKDTIETAGLRTTSGSRLRADYVPTVDATAVARLKSAGVIILGKTNTPELAIPYETDNPVFGRTNNPLDVKMTPGGSSGGEAAAIAACLSPAGLGSDLSGSIRVPAHFCGISGLKPTSGLIPMDGHTPSAMGALSQGACIGPMARRIEDLSLLFSSLVPAWFHDSVFEHDLRGLRAGWYIADGISPVTEETVLAVTTAAEILGEAGLEIIESRPPGVERASGLWIDLFAGVSNVQTRQLYAGREEQAGPLVRKLLSSKASYEPAVERGAFNERNGLRAELLDWMKRMPLLIAPVGATPAFAHGSDRIDCDGRSISIFRAFSYSQAFNVFDLPVVTVRAGASREGLPIGVQIIGQPFAEAMVLAAAAIVERGVSPRTS